MNRTALICGVSGQGGAWLTDLLLRKVHQVWGTSRDAQASPFTNLVRLGIRDKVHLFSMDTKDFPSVYAGLGRVWPEVVYFLDGQSSVGLSFEQPVETMQRIAHGTLNMLEACRMMDYPVRLYHASSSECFGDVGDAAANEATAFHPRSPYAVAKASAYWLVSNYREAHSLFACAGILFNHESPLRPKHFVTRKIVDAAARIAAGSNEILTLGRLDIARDWGWAPECVQAMWLMLQQPELGEFVVATGKTHTLQEFVVRAFDGCGLDWRDHVEQSPKFYRPTDLSITRGDPSKAERTLGWKAETLMEDVVARMAKAAADAHETSN